MAAVGSQSEQEAEPAEIPRAPTNRAVAACTPPGRPSLVGGVADVGCRLDDAASTRRHRRHALGQQDGPRVVFVARGRPTLGTIDTADNRGRAKGSAIGSLPGAGQPTSFTVEPTGQSGISAGGCHASTSRDASASAQSTSRALAPALDPPK